MSDDATALHLAPAEWDDRLRELRDQWPDPPETREVHDELTRLARYARAAFRATDAEAWALRLELAALCEQWLVDHLWEQWEACECGGHLEEPHELWGRSIEHDEDRFEEVRWYAIDRLREAGLTRIVALAKGPRD